jgi:hypothetical protein
MYLFLRRSVRPPAAALGAIAFGVSGPIVSSTNFPNMSWSLAALPFVFWALERLFARRTAAAAALLALMVAFQALAGEPVSLGATLAAAFAYAVLPRPRRGDIRLAALTAYGLGMGTLLAAIQYVPLGLAALWIGARHDHRRDFWTFHPLALLELVVPHFYGDYFQSNLRELAWMLALNSQRDPFYYTMYIGVPIALLAAIAMASGRTGTRFWTVVVVLLRRGVARRAHADLSGAAGDSAAAQSFRFPVKYLSLAAFGLAALAAIAFEWMLDGDVPRPSLRRVIVAALGIAG